MAPTAHADVRRWRRNLADERAEAQVYRELARHRTGEEREILLALADAEGRHAAHWEELLGDRVGEPVRPSWQFRVLARMARWFGSVFVLALAQRAEARASADVDADATATMAADERIHEEVVRGLAARGRTRLSGTFRAAVFGANDGLVSNLALVIGVVAARVDTRTVLLTGLAGLLAGALSMGAGEFISVRSQRELLAASALGTGAEHALPHLGQANELALVYRARGMSAQDAEARAEEVLADIAELGQASTAFRGDHPAEEHAAVGTDIGASLSSFTFFASGAAIPVLPWAFGMSGTAALLLAVGAVGVALLLVGAVVGLISGGPPVRRAVRQLAIGIGAAAVTYGLGAAFGASGG
ncbi:VIT1/CCC1 family protein [Isoptericola sp. b441]|uniref:VIT1/CCC1 family protein n=1 Tax=Actinotalea lenta TaxID=3064654 RepID=A0ABT9D5D1_9CELL|nr:MULTISPECIES: VIT1/CCC1 family protein [unclassified Isoptericola]MDO8105982.1 VIT1/CCC1 family protein [Isoptericola sp. b441]MDO8122299.1 VIT1/CCC1 family protein [Isoptericola sp. b490]